MILIWAVVAGLLAGLGWAWIRRDSYHPPELKLVWLVPAAYLPQLLAFNWPAARQLIPDFLAAAALVCSQILLLVFAWRNRSRPGFWALGLGLALNLLVIAANGGLMPISPEIVTRLSPNAPADSWLVGQRLWEGKDVVLTIEATRLWWLSDRLLTPDWLPFQVAFSIGDIFIAVGAFWLLCSAGGPESKSYPRLVSSTS
jgi:hypothetical protein